MSHCLASHGPGRADERSRQERVPRSQPPWGSSPKPNNLQRESGRKATYNSGQHENGLEHETTPSQHASPTAKRRRTANDVDHGYDPRRTPTIPCAILECSTDPSSDVPKGAAGECIPTAAPDAKPYTTQSIKTKRSERSDNIESGSEYRLKIAHYTSQIEQFARAVWPTAFLTTRPPSDQQTQPTDEMPPITHASKHIDILRLHLQDQLFLAVLKGNFSAFDDATRPQICLAVAQLLTHDAPSVSNEHLCNLEKGARIFCAWMHAHEILYHFRARTRFHGRLAEWESHMRDVEPWREHMEAMRARGLLVKTGLQWKYEDGSVSVGEMAKQLMLFFMELVGQRWSVTDGNCVVEGLRDYNKELVEWFGA
ncbi:hypothetical protein EJ04DRAFT_570720 [Polyplosphaeria fusca]|uniref:Uncharacterized protein n=1 Tax=Polyplosphaeria fusca TaxID=682080 RepID=A0A9P4QLQ7_9PLEO|nr:hypothetical protein EJ04DRAFT_570720 [Polyplosphaeria fusca]